MERATHPFDGGPGTRARRGRSDQGHAWGGWGPGWGGGWGGGGRRRMRRGDMRRAILAALHDGPAHGYEVMGRLEARSGGLWRPSPGSVYPTLQMLEDEGMVTSRTLDGTRVYELTDAGKADAEAAGTERAPWERGDGNDDRQRALRVTLVETMQAVKQVSHAGRPEQIDRAVEVLQQAKKDLYKILADG